MPYFSKLRGRRSTFYNRLWTELEHVRVIDTHEHLTPPGLWPRVIEKTGVMLPHVFNGSYLSPIVEKPGAYQDWIEQVARYKHTGYFKSMAWAIDELYGLEPPVTKDYLQKLDALLKDVYSKDPVGHVKDVIENKMHVEAAILNIGFEEHVEFSKCVPAIKAATPLPSVLDGIQVPGKITPASGIVYAFAAGHLNKEPSDFKAFDDYVESTRRLLEYCKASGNYTCHKNQCAYRRPLFFPEPDDDVSTVAKLYNKHGYSEQELWKFGDYMFHYILEWTATHWNVPVQLHTGLARMLYGDSNAINASHLFEKFPDLKFDLFHGNYPYNNLAGILHQIPNVYADLCWLPIISPTAAVRTLVELVEVGGHMAGLEADATPALRTSVFGGDCRAVEGSYGALLMAKDAVIRAIEDLHDRGHVASEADGVLLAEQMLFSNPKRLFFSC
ncbi:MAG: amidohydrolase family protein [Candidatus Lokiarchaeota archaeon]|nr:amidohydrolase family protein [Candidatus Lokiarchaeota archaeon]